MIFFFILKFTILFIIEAFDFYRANNDLNVEPKKESKKNLFGEQIVVESRKNKRSIYR
jgi:hypothetical protein